VAAELVIRQRMNVLARALPAVKRGDAAAIHQARVATRRLREAMSLAGSGAGARKIGATLRRWTRALGPVRELDVTIDILTSLAESGELPNAAATFLAGVLRDERRRLHASVVRQLERCNIDKLQRKAIAACTSAAVTPQRRADPKRLAVARERAGRRAVALREAMDRAAAIYMPERLHEVRLAVKKLRYAMEIVRELSRSRAYARLRRLKAAQDLLGRMHDLEMIIARTRAIQGSPHAPDLRLSADLDRLVRRLETECRQLHGHYIASRGELLRICDDVVTSGRPRGRAAA
jgi:CHAD domain-containing protein